MTDGKADKFIHRTCDPSTRLPASVTNISFSSKKDSWYSGFKPEFRS